MTLPCKIPCLLDCWTILLKTFLDNFYMAVWCLRGICNRHDLVIENEFAEYFYPFMLMAAKRKVPIPTYNALLMLNVCKNLTERNGIKPIHFLQQIYLRDLFLINDNMVEANIMGLFYSILAGRLARC